MPHEADTPLLPAGQLYAIAEADVYVTYAYASSLHFV